MGIMRIVIGFVVGALSMLVVQSLLRMYKESQKEKARLRWNREIQERRSQEKAVADKIKDALLLFLPKFMIRVGSERSYGYHEVHVWIVGDPRSSYRARVTFGDTGEAEINVLDIRRGKSVCYSAENLDQAIDAMKARIIADHAELFPVPHMD